MSKKLFVCCTTYQIFNCINYNFMNKKENDVYDLVICNHFQNAKQIYKNCSDSAIWNHCYYMVTEYHRNIFETISIICGINYQTMIEGKTEFVWDYDEVFIGTFNNISSIIAYRYCKSGKAKLTIIDEGLGTYILKSFEYGFPKGQRTLRKMLHHVIQSKEVNAVLLYEPKYYRGTVSIDIKKLPTITRDNKAFVSVINKTFQYRDSDNGTQAVIFFDQPIQTVMLEGNEVSYENFLAMLVRHIDPLVNKSDFCIQWHPRTDNNIKSKFSDNPSRNTSYGGWEIDLLNSNTHINHIYITIFSSAALLGNIIFEDDDIIIFLYKMIEYEVENLEVILHTMRRNGVQIFVPNSWDEFDAVLKESYRQQNDV